MRVQRASVEYTWKARARGFSKNRLYHLVDQGLNGLISFTNVPLRLAMFFGFSVAILSFLYGLVTFAINCVYYRQLAPSGIATLIVAVFFFSGLQLFFFGILGEYVGAIDSQVRRRPLVIERERINFAKDTAASDGNRRALDRGRQGPRSGCVRRRCLFCLHVDRGGSCELCIEHRGLGSQSPVLQPEGLDLPDPKAIGHGGEHLPVLFFRAMVFALVRTHDQLQQHPVLPGHRMGSNRWRAQSVLRHSLKAMKTLTSARSSR